MSNSILPLSPCGRGWRVARLRAASRVRGHRRQVRKNPSPALAEPVIGPRDFARVRWLGHPLPQGERGKPSDVVLAARFLRPSFCRPSQSSHEAIRRERAKLFRLRNASNRLAPAKNKESGTPADALSCARTQAACGTRHGERRLAPPSACGRARLPAFHLRFSPTGLSSRGLSFGPGFPRAMRKLRRAARFAVGHSDAPRAPVVLPAGMMPEPPGSGVYLSARG
jgi:hypothetical protein